MRILEIWLIYWVFNLMAFSIYSNYIVKRYDLEKYECVQFGIMLIVFLLGGVIVSMILGRF